MENSEVAKVNLQGQPAVDVGVIELSDSQSFTIELGKGEGIHLSSFTTSVFAEAKRRVGTERYVFEGPRLGFYYDTADPREGPYVNHYINYLEIDLQYRSANSVFV